MFLIEYDDLISCWSLYFPENHTNSPAYCKYNLMDVQAFPSRRQLSSLMVTITLNPWREDLGRLVISISNRSNMFPNTDIPRGSSTGNFCWGAEPVRKLYH